ncbi:MAG: hypothetical protein ACI8V2_002066 [Candidatus Latescibacterota bacterium]
MIGLLSIHCLLQIWHYEWQKLPWLVRQIWDVDEEDTIPTWYSASALLLTSLLLCLIGKRKQADQDPWVRYWYGLALGFAFLSMDEIAGLHETVNGLVEYSWAIIGGIIVAIVGLLYLRFLWHLPASTRWLFVASGAIFVGGAVGVEMSTDWYEDADLLNTLAYNLWTAVEEGMEMGGIVLFIHALLKYINQEQGAHIDLNVAELTK